MSNSRLCRKIWDCWIVGYMENLKYGAIVSHVSAFLLSLRKKKILSLYHTSIRFWSDYH